MLGTPNGGSHAIGMVLTGRGNGPIRRLALLDFKHDLEELLDIVRAYPGVAEMLPYELHRIPPHGQISLDLNIHLLPLRHSIMPRVYGTTLKPKQKTSIQNGFFTLPGKHQRRRLV